ncbi:MAG: phosphoribosyl-ATP diphosphatase [Magnetococcus sp. DMHC-6]
MTTPLVETLFKELYQVIQSRRQSADPKHSYVARLFAEGPDRILQKVGEEAVETILAAKNRDSHSVIHETADLWFHSLVLLAEQGIDPQQVVQELINRFHLPNQ